MPGKKSVRAAFRGAVFRRDRYRCVACGQPGRDRQGGDAHAAYHAAASPGPLDAHHVTDRHAMPNGGYVPENGVTLCDDCHPLAEVFHQTGVPYPGFAPADLYARIGSSREAAHRASLKLE